MRQPSAPACTGRKQRLVAAEFVDQSLSARQQVARKSLNPVVHEATVLAKQIHEITTA